ncbi:MAG: PE family protein, partial [Polyangiaceae bacterium]|nr:PE family protein [Polyangiaceae bacterium]
MAAGRGYPGGVLGRLATSATVIALVGYGCAQGEGLPPGAGSGGVGGDLDASLGGGPTGGMGGSSGAVTGGAAGSGGGPAGAGGLSTDASVGGAGASGGVGGS